MTKNNKKIGMILWLIGVIVFQARNAAIANSYFVAAINRVGTETSCSICETRI
jgi:hypothetical protein